MHRILFGLFIGLIMIAPARVRAQQALYGEDRQIILWDNDSAPHSNGLEGGDQALGNNRVGNTTDAVLYIFRADPARATGQSVVICPGGGYVRLAMAHEGYQLAQWFASQGITAAVLKYRMPNGHPEVPLEDAVEALRVLALQTDLGVDPARIGICGSSAGGHLAAMASTIGAIRPAFSILFYPVITGEEGKCHRGSFDNLLGVDRTPDLTAAYSLETRVTGQTPPALLLLSDDDRSVPSVNSVRYYTALKEHGIRASLHIYPTGGHGWGIRETFPYRPCWQQALLDWLKESKL